MWHCTRRVYNNNNAKLAKALLYTMFPLLFCLSSHLPDTRVRLSGSLHASHQYVSESSPLFLLSIHLSILLQIACNSSSLPLFCPSLTSTSLSHFLIPYLPLTLLSPPPPILFHCDCKTQQLGVSCSTQPSFQSSLHLGSGAAGPKPRPENNSDSLSHTLPSYGAYVKCNLNIHTLAVSPFSFSIFLFHPTIQLPVTDANAGWKPALLMLQFFEA